MKVYSDISFIERGEIKEWFYLISSISTEFQFQLIVLCKNWMTFKSLILCRKKK